MRNIQFLLCGLAAAIITLSCGTVKAGFPSPADDFREKLDLVKLLVRHSASTFLFQIDGVSMVDADMDEGDIIIVDRAVEPDNDFLIWGVVTWVIKKV